jgi:diguanylate cyclase (GGDEF)-like protein
VLAVEDDPDHAAFVRMVLESAGFQVRTCADPRRFEADLTAFRPDLVIMDLNLGEVSGTDLVRYIRQDEQHATLPIVYLTGEERLQARIESVRAGGDDYLVKPVPPGMLLATVASRIERSRFLKSLLDRDGLTRLLTHASFMDAAKVAVARLGRQPSLKLALVLLDIDNFKSINDRFGHQTGDRVLVSLAAILRRRLRRSDTLGRYGGEEFGLVLEDLDEAEATRLVQRLLDEFATTDQVAIGGERFHVRFSAGIAVPEPGVTLEQWVRSADEALYAAKAAGRNCIRVAGDSRG